MNENIIAFDGPAGSGKSSVAREVASENGFHYMDSGAYYRAVTFFLLEESKKDNPTSFKSWMETGKWKSYLDKIKLDTNFISSEENKTSLNGKDISKEIRTPEVTEEIKHVAIIAEIRKLVNTNLYELSKKYKIVMDGRDIGTEVFPDAKFKFYITASADVRARRRFLEFETKGIKVDFEQLKQDIIKRDESDMNRSIAPLKQADDAIFLDTSNMTKEEVKDYILEKIK